MARLNSSMSSKLTEDIIDKLEIHKVFTTFDFLEESTEKLTSMTGLRFKDIMEVKQIMISNFGGKMGDTLQLLEAQSRVLPTEISSLDNLLEGGLHPGQLYEICGRSSAGKSQLCLALTANIASRSNGIVHYIHAGNNFSAIRIQMMLAARKLSDKNIGEILSQIKVTQVKAVHELLNLLHSLTRLLKQDHCTYKLVIIDSLPLLFNMSETNSDNYSALNHIANVCRFLANEYCLPIMIVNLVTRWRNFADFTTSSSVTVSTMNSSIKPFLGRYWSNIPNTRLFIEQSYNENRKITVWKSGHIKIGSSIRVTINDAGFV